MLKAFTKFLALAKVGYNCAHKLYGEAQKKNDAHTIKFLECAIFEAVSGLLLVFVGVSLHYGMHEKFSAPCHMSNKLHASVVQVCSLTLHLHFPLLGDI